MSEVVPNGPVSADEPQTQAAPQEPVGEVNKGDLEARFRSDPDFGLTEYKKLQSDHGRLNTRLSHLGSVEDVARAIGNGDVKQGAELLAQYANVTHQITQNPELNQMVQTALTTGQIPKAEASDSQEDEWVDPEIKSLRGMVETLQGQLNKVSANAGATKMTTLVNEFLNTDLGRSLTPEERTEFSQSLQNSVRSWSNAPNGNELLNNLDQGQVEVMALNHFNRAGKLAEIYGRVAAGKQQNRARFNTEGPNEIASGDSLAPNEFENAVDALRYAMERERTTR